MEIYKGIGVTEVWTSLCLIIFSWPKYYTRPYAMLSINFYESLGWLRISLSYGKWWIPKIKVSRHNLIW